MASVKIVGGIWIWISLQLFLLQVAKCTPNTSMNQWRCNVNEFSEDDPYLNHVVDVLYDLTSATSKADDYDFHNQSPIYGQGVAYGHGTCTILLTYEDCDKCMAAAKDAIWDICYHKIGGTVELGDCTIRYENYSF